MVKKERSAASWPQLIAEVLRERFSLQSDPSRCRTVQLSFSCCTSRSRDPQRPSENCSRRSVVKPDVAISVASAITFV